MSRESRLRVAVWSTGGVGSRAIAAVSRRPDLELVGVWVHTPDKVGREVGEIIGCEHLGIAATNDAQEIIDLAPDCVVYAASGPERGAGAVPDYERLLSHGINVVTTTSTALVFPPTSDPALHDLLARAAVAGGASLYASGIFPGFASDQLALVLTTLSSTIRSVRVVEVSLNDHYPVASVMQDGMGFGRPLEFEPFIGQPGVIPLVWQAPIQLIARGLGVDMDDITGRFDRALTERDLDVAFGTIPVGTVGAVRMIASGIVDQREAIVVEHVIRMARDVAPDWPASADDATYLVRIEGEPDIDMRLSLGEAEGHGAGNSAMTATAMRVVNAVPYVVEAAPGLLSSLDLPLTVPRHSV
jgi:2,4-diaminopentanoate dehydrogenase